MARRPPTCHLSDYSASGLCRKLYADRDTVPAGPRCSAGGSASIAQRSRLSEERDVESLLQTMSLVRSAYLPLLGLICQSPRAPQSLSMDMIASGGNDDDSVSLQCCTLQGVLGSRGPHRPPKPCTPSLCGRHRAAARRSLIQPRSPALMSVVARRRIH